MAENQKPTSRLQRWAESIGCDLTEWDFQQWREFADRSGAVLTRIERQLYQFKIKNSKLKIKNSEGVWVSGFESVALF